MCQGGGFSGLLQVAESRSETKEAVGQGSVALQGQVCKTEALSGAVHGSIDC